MLTKRKIRCKTCAKAVDYLRDSKLYCSQACKDAYHYAQKKDIIKERKLQAKRAKMPPVCQYELHPQVKERLEKESNTILAELAQLQKDIDQLHVQAGEVQGKAVMVDLRLKKCELELSQKKTLLQEATSNHTSYQQEIKKVQKEELSTADILVKTKNLMESYKQGFYATCEPQVLQHQISLLEKEIDEKNKEMEKLVSLYNMLQDQIFEKSECLLERQYALNETRPLPNGKIIPATKDLQTSGNTSPLYSLSDVASTKSYPQKQTEKQRVNLGIVKQDIASNQLQATSKAAHTKLTANTNVKEISVQEATEGGGWQGFFLGLDSKNRPMFWHPLTCSNPHVLIVGMSGSGKTQLLSIINYLASSRSIPTFMLDFDKGLLDENLANKSGQSFVSLIDAQLMNAADGLPFNPLALPKGKGGQVETHFGDLAASLSQSLSKIYKLQGPVQQANLCEAIEEAYTQSGFHPKDKSTWMLSPPSFSMVWSILEKKGSGDSHANMLTKLKPLLTRDLFLASEQAIDGLFTQHTIVSLASLPTKEAQVAISRLFLKKIFDYMVQLGPTKELRLLITIDEAHILSQDPLVQDMLRQARKFGIGLLLASQSAKDFDPVVFSTVATKIALRLEGEDARAMAANMGLVSKGDRDRIRKKISEQATLCGLIRNNSYQPYKEVNFTPLWERE